LNENIILSRTLADDVTVLFYVFSFDVRGMPLDQAHHYSAPDVFGNRASFRTVTDPACLFVDEVHRNDEGVYRCRVDFRNSATKSFRYNLSVIGKWSTPTPILFWNSYKQTPSSIFLSRYNYKCTGTWHDDCLISI